MSTQFVVDDNANKLAAILPIKKYNKIIDALEELEDIRLYDEGKNDNEPALSKSEAMAMLEAERKKMDK